MSENRQARHVREVGSTDNLASRLAPLAAQYIKIVSDENEGIPVTFTLPYDDPIRNWAHVQRAASLVSAAITKGKKSTASRDDKQSYAGEAFRDYKFTDELGDFGESVLTQAIGRVALGICQDQGKVATTVQYKDLDRTSKDGKLVLAIATKIGNDPANADKYQPMVEAMVNTILATRHGKQRRSAGNPESPLDTNEVDSVAL